MPLMQALRMLLGDKEDVVKVAQEAIAYGAEKVYVMESRAQTVPYRSYARAAVDLIRKYKPEIVLFGATTRVEIMQGRWPPRSRQD